MTVAHMELPLESLASDLRRIRREMLSFQTFRVGARRVSGGYEVGCELL